MIISSRLPLVLTNIFLLLCISISFSQIPLSGEITGTIKKLDYPYLVEKDLIVPMGKECTIEAGTVFLFKAYSGIKVFGKLDVNGTDSHLVVFTSALDRTFNRDTSRITEGVPVAAAFDWNGMDIMEQAGMSTIKNASFWYTVNGIYARNNDVIIDKCYFNFTGNIDVRINDKPYTVTPGTTFSYRPVSEIVPVPSNPNPVPIQPPWHKRMNKEIRIGCIGITTLGLVTGAVFGTLALVNRHELAQQNADFKKEGSDRFTRTEYNTTKEQYHTNLTGMTIALSAGTLGALGFLLTLELKK